MLHTERHTVVERTPERTLAERLRTQRKYPKAGGRVSGSAQQQCSAFRITKKLASNLNHVAWANHPSSLCLCFFTSKMKVIVPHRIK